MIYIGGDKYGYGLITFISQYLKNHNIDYQNLGVTSDSQSMGLEGLIPKVVGKVKEAGENSGILVCGTGVGIEIGANRFKGIRASLCNTPKLAEWARNKDNANVLCLSAWEFEPANIEAVLNAWFATQYDGDKDRLKMFSTFDEWS